MSLWISQFQTPTLPPRATLGVLHLLSARVPGFVPLELPGVARGSDLLSIIKVPSCQLMRMKALFSFKLICHLCCKAETLSMIHKQKLEGMTRE